MQSTTHTVLIPLLFLSWHCLGALLGKGGELEKEGSECEGCYWALIFSEQMDGSNLVIASGLPNSGDAKRA